jgi:tellurite resistance protein TerA
MDIKPKVILKQKGDSTEIAQKLTRIQVQMTWTKGVDLDLYAFYRTKTGKTGEVNFSDKGDLTKYPFIALDQDAGVGNTAGENEENLTIASLENMETVLIATNIFRFFGFLSKGDNFARYDGKVSLKTNAGDHIEVPLTSNEIGKWCVIAAIDNSNPNSPKVININRVQKSEPDLATFQLN